jgi:hypothetical protein
MGYGSDLLGAGLNLMGGESGGDAGGVLGGFLGGDSGGAVGGIVGGFLGGGGKGALGAIGSNFLGDDAGSIVDNFAGSEGLGNMIGGLMQGDDGIGGLLGSSNAGDALGGLLGNSGLASGVSNMLGGESANWLGGLTTAVSGSGGVVGTIGQAAGGNFGGVSGIAEQLGETVGGDLGGVLGAVGAATSGEGAWFDTLENVIEGAGDSFGSPAGILGTVQELAGNGPAWLQTATSVADQLGEGNLSELATSVLGESPALQNVADSFGDSGLVGTALGELGNWEELAEDGLGALGVDLPDIGGAVAALGSLTAESIVEAESGALGADSLAAESIESEPIAGLGDDLLGDESLDAAAIVESAATGVPEPDPDLESPLSGGPNDNDQFDVEFEADPTAPSDSDPTAFIDDGPVFDEPVPMDNLAEAVESADELESSVDDLFEGLE